MPETSEPCGYAKLWGKVMNEDFLAYVDKSVCMLGRTLSSRESEEIGDAQLIEIGSHKSISKHHATIEWDKEVHLFKITCFGKNGMVVDNKSYSKSEKAYLKSKSTIGIGRISYFYFLLPIPALPQKLDTHVIPKISTNPPEVVDFEHETKKTQLYVESKPLKLIIQGALTPSGNKVEESEKTKRNSNVTPGRSDENNNSETKSISAGKKMNENNRSRVVEENESLSPIKKKKIRLSNENKVQVSESSTSQIKASPASKKS